MNIGIAISQRVRTLLKNKRMSQHRLEEKSGISHGTMNCFLNNRYKSCNFITILKIVRALKISIKDFFDDPIFNISELNVDDIVNQ